MRPKRKPIRRWTSACLLVLLATRVAAEPPPPLQPGERPSDGSTEAELWYGIDRAEKDVRASPILVRDRQLNAYVRGVVCTVTADYCKDLRVYVVDVPVFNAQMAPNGAVLVFTGALLRMHDEAELAILLGHEFAHYRDRHGLQYWNKAKHTSAVFASVGAGGGLAGGIAEMAGSASLSGFARDVEREADREGFATAVALGYDPQAGVRMWSRFLREERANPASKRSAVFASHPKTEERLEDVRAAANAVAATSAPRNNHDAYRAAIRPFLAHWLDEELSRRTYDSSIQMIEDLREGAPADTAGTLAFYLAQAHRQRAHPEDAAIASALYKDAVSHADAPADAWREYGLDLRQNGLHADAANALHRYLAMAPDAADRAFIDRYLSDLEKAP